MDPNHVCEEHIYCNCYQLGDEPKESCPMHGFAIPRCICGRFVKSKRYEFEEPKPDRNSGGPPK